jgi:glycosyltransferase involved in cell wall biosynthesis
MNKKIAIFIPAYQVSKTITSVIDRIPKKIYNSVEEIYVFDNCSTDDTYKVVINYKKKKNLSKLNVFRNNKNLGYGGTQIKAYKYAISKNYDIVVMLHADGQYPPEMIGKLLQPLLKGEADMVFGSRINGNPLEGNMPYYKYVGNRFLTILENAVFGLHLTEYHSGFRAYRVNALKKVPFEFCNIDYSFDTDIIVQFKIANLIIKEITIPTHYDEYSRTITARGSFKVGFKILHIILEYLFNMLGIVKVRKFEG